MSDNLNMTISEVVNKDGQKNIYVLFSDGQRSAEGRLPEGKLISNKGFSEEEAEALEQYLLLNAESITETAKSVNVMKNFLES